MLELNKLYLMDCMEGMAQFPDNYFDLCLTDPPYNLNRTYNEYNDNRSDYKEWCFMWFTELKRISKKVVLSVGVKNLSMWYDIEPPLWLWCWYKGNNMGSGSKYTNIGLWEPFLMYGEIERLGVDGKLLPIVPQKDAAFHDCPKPLKLIRHLINEFSEQGNKIIDPFAGSNTTGLACNIDNRNWIAFEIDQDYYNAASKRIEIHKQQLRLPLI